jgi:hypothetical protein
VSVTTAAYPGNPNAVDLVTLSQVIPAGPSFRCHLVGEDVLSEGEAKWEINDRPGRTDLPEWVGSGLHLLTLPLKLHGWGVLPGGGSISVQPQYERLLEWRRPLVDSSGKTLSKIPPALTVAGPIRQLPYGARWYIERLDWGQGVYGEGALAGVLISQDFTLALREYVAGEVLRGSAAQARAKAGL